MRRVRFGSRDSQLSVRQSQLIIEQVTRAHPEVEAELITMKTTGDKILDRTLEEIGGKGLFVRELDRALLDRRVDFTIHSLKDLPGELPPEPFLEASHPTALFHILREEKIHDWVTCQDTQILA